MGGQAPKWPLALGGSGPVGPTEVDPQPKQQSIGSAAVVELAVVGNRQTRTVNTQMDHATCVATDRILCMRCALIMIKITNSFCCMTFLSRQTDRNIILSKFRRFVIFQQPHFDDGLK